MAESDKGEKKIATASDEGAADVRRAVADTDIFAQLFKEVAEQQKANATAGEKKEVKKADEAETKTEPEKKEDKTEEKPVDSGGVETKEAVSDAKPEAGPDKSADKPKRTVKKFQSKPAPVQPTIDVERITEVAARAATKALEDSRPVSKETKDDELTEAVREEIDTYKELERLDPKRYENIAKRMSAFEKAEESRAIKWEEENSGQTYDPDADEHKAWYDKNEVAISPIHMNRARARAEARAVQREEVSQEINEVKQQLKIARAEPLSNQAQAFAKATIVASVLPEDQRNADGVRKLIEQDPETAAIVARESTRISPIIADIPMLYQHAIRFDPKKQAHNEIVKYLNQFEGELVESFEENPALASVDGKTWVPLATYEQMSEAKKSQHWAVSDQQLVTYVTYQTVDEVRKKREESAEFFEKMAAARGYRKSDVSKPSQEESKKKDDTNGEVKRETQSPSMGTRPVSAVKDDSKSKQETPFDPLFRALGVIP